LKKWEWGGLRLFWPIFIIVLLIILLVTILSLIKTAKRELRRASRTIFGTDSLLQGFKQQEINFEETPKSISNMSTVLQPLIAKDFPDFNVKEFIQKSENMLLSVFNAIEAKDITMVASASWDLKAQVQNLILDLKSRKETEYYNNVKIHATGINKYQKDGGTCVIVLQTALEYIHYLENDSQVVIRGSKDRKVQVRYDVELLYVQDLEKVKERTSEAAFGLNCPNCGAAITNLGSKHCEYCGTQIQEVNVKAWSINRFTPH
jgi:endogenous inhibitor of DNA gyrase (YacG/DUF329 family)